MKSNFLAATGITLLILGILSLSWYLTQESNPNTDSNKAEQTTQESNFQLESTYTGDNKWDYKVNGTLPNPCYKVQTQEIIRESYPEQVSIQIKVTPPDTGAICTQVIQDYEYEGVFNASKDAQITLDVQ